MVALIVCGLGHFSSSTQTQIQKHSGANATASQNASQHQDPAASRTMTPEDGLSVIASALDSRVRQRSGSDCSHLVHAIYARAGFPYAYVSSSSLFVGTKEFQRVGYPQPGDLVVWRGHVGIVVNPAQHAFFSTLRSGPGVDAYDAPYWKQRGQFRFYRYIKGSSARHVPNRLVLIDHSK